MTEFRDVFPYLVSPVNEVGEICADVLTQLRETTSSNRGCTDLRRWDLQASLPI